MSTTAASSVTLLGTEPPPVRRDPVVWSWVGAAAVSWFGDAVFNVALAWTAVRELSPGLAGVVIGVGTLPQALLMLAGGVIADRFDTRRVMVAGELLRTLVLVVAAISWQLGQHSAAVLIMVGVTFGVAAGLSGPAQSTLVRQLVRSDDLVTVSGWLQVGARMATLAGAPVGAVVVAAAGLPVAMLIDAATFLSVLMLLIMVIRTRYRLPRQTDGTPWRNLVDGLSYLARNPRPRTLTLGISSLNVFITPVVAVGVSLRVSAAGWTPTWVGVAEGCLAAGAIGGSVLAIRWRGNRMAARAFWVLVIQGAGLACVGLPSRTGLVASMIAIGLTAGLASVWISGIFQREIAPSHLGRVSSVSRLGDLSLTPFMSPLFGVLAGAANVLTATIACGVAMSLLCLTIATRRTIRELE